MSLIEWDKQFNFRIRECNKAKDKHELCKLLIIRKLIRKYQSKKQYIKIYSDFELLDGLICDIYFENYNEKVKFAFEIQKDEEGKTKMEKYSEWEDMFYKTELIKINLNRLSNNIEEMEKQLEEFII